ncbi:MAG TPA: hypothetical protein VH419_07905 [Nocardioidaceae bacterium]|jgi:ketosteroid isomerase-like protein
MLEATTADWREIADWVTTFGGHVRRREFADAAEQFDPAVVSFSSLRDVVVGLDDLIEHQWQHVWPTIDGFEFDVDALHAFISPDRCLAVAAVTWTSTGFDAEGDPFDRPGRATLVLGRDRPSAPWHGIHAHFSLNRGVPQPTVA